jgi:hypothetical protein
VTGVNDSETARGPKEGEPSPAPSTFDWRVYADATCAGLTALIPLPILDLAFESYFRRRMPHAISRARRRESDRLAMIRLGRRRSAAPSWLGCLSVPLMIARYVVKKLWRKVVYVFAIVDATSQLSEYWHRAYLVDHMVSAGHLEPGVDTERAVEVFATVLAEADTSPLRGLAQQVISSSHRILRLLIRARRRDPVTAAESLGQILRDHWGSAEASLRSMANRYNRLYVSWPDRAGVG